MSKFNHTLPRTFIGFDELFGAFNQAETPSNYPPYNIKRVGADYVIELAVAGFVRENLIIGVDGAILSIEGNTNEDKTGDYIHHGIASRSFYRKFTLKESVEVVSSVLANGILTIVLKDTPKNTKRVIDIG